MRPKIFLTALLSVAICGMLNARLVNLQTAEEVAVNWQSYQLRDQQVIDKTFSIEFDFFLIFFTTSIVNPIIATN